MVGSQLASSGMTLHAEEAYSFYIAVMEALFGEKSMEVSHCYFLISGFYLEACLYEKAEYSLKKTIAMIEDIRSQLRV